MQSLALGFPLFLQGRLPFQTQPNERPVRVKDFEGGFRSPFGFVLGPVVVFRVTSSASVGGFFLIK